MFVTAFSLDNSSALLRQTLTTSARAKVAALAQMPILSQNGEAHERIPPLSAPRGRRPARCSSGPRAAGHLLALV
jgi:hypothetical protein